MIHTHTHTPTHIYVYIFKNAMHMTVIRFTAGQKRIMVQ